MSHTPCDDARRRRHRPVRRRIRMEMYGYCVHIDLFTFNLSFNITNLWQCLINY